MLIKVGNFAIIYASLFGNTGSPATASIVFGNCQMLDIVGGIGGGNVASYWQEEFSTGAIDDNAPFICQMVKIIATNAYITLTWTGGMTTSVGVDFYVIGIASPAN